MQKGGGELNMRLMAVGNKPDRLTPNGVEQPDVGIVGLVDRKVVQGQQLNDRKALYAHQVECVHEAGVQVSLLLVKSLPPPLQAPEVLNLYKQYRHQQNLLRQFQIGNKRGCRKKKLNHYLRR